MFVCPYSLPKDQDCHELWSKRRKKSMREASKQDQPSAGHPPAHATNSATNKPGFNNHHHRTAAAAPKFPPMVPAPVAAPPTVSKSNNSQGDNKPPEHVSSGSYTKPHHLSQGGSMLSRGDGVSSKGSSASAFGYTSLSAKVDVIPGLDFTGDPMSHDPPKQQVAPPVDKTPPQEGTSSMHRQLALMLQMLQSNVGGRSKLSIDDLASTLKVPIDSSTKALLDNLSSQLYVATKPSDEESPVDSSRGRVAPETIGDNVYRGVSSSSRPYEPDSFPSRFHNPEPPAAAGSFAKQSSGGSTGSGSDQNAGIKAALAQLLTDKGVSVKLGANSFSGGATSPKVSNRGDGAVVKDAGPRGERLYSQQTSFDSHMSVSDDAHVDSNYGSMTGTTGPPVETMSVRAKVQNFFERSDDGKRQTNPAPQTHLFPIVQHGSHPTASPAMPGGSYMGSGRSSNAPKGILKSSYHGSGGSKGGMWELSGVGKK